MGSSPATGTIAQFSPSQFWTRTPRRSYSAGVSNAVVAVLPARWGSTRFPGKALHPIAGRPLIQHVWERCQRARRLAGVIVATDDMRIAEVAFGFGAEVAMTSTRHRSGTDRVAEVARKLRGVSHVINVQGDEPMISPKLIDQLAGTLLDEPRVEMITAANRFAPGEDVTNPSAVKVVLDRDSNALYFSRAPIPLLARRDRARAALSTPGNLWLFSSAFAEVCEVEANPARTDRTARAVARAGTRGAESGWPSRRGFQPAWTGRKTWPWWRKCSVADQAGPRPRGCPASAGRREPDFSFCII